MRQQEWSTLGVKRSEEPTKGPPSLSESMLTFKETQARVAGKPSARDENESVRGVRGHRIACAWHEKAEQHWKIISVQGSKV